jgi:adenylyltransferase/sulfurtransferase
VNSDIGIAMSDERQELEFSDERLLRYSRQIMLPEIGIEGQAKLWKSHALIIGMGGLGAPISMYLAASGVGRLTIVDDDCVDLSNLQRQIVHTTERVGMEKVESARQGLLELNPEIDIRMVNRRLDEPALDDLLRDTDVAVEATDSFGARFALNRSCLRQNVALVSGAVIRMEGQVSVFRPGASDSPCYNCLHRETDDVRATCAESGVLGSVAGIIGTVQATEAIKVLLGIGTTLTGRVLMLDALHMEWHSMRLRKNPKCPTCGDESNRADRTDAKSTSSDQASQPA